ncbi:MAG: histidinol-phosphate transaminase [Deltaproteobacteria bacterium]|nr:histidinol-phosphate transaminase [Deltaproteobacteria bacterium]
MTRVPEHIRKLTPYVPGKPIDEVERELGLKKTVKLASNENPLGPSPKALDAVSRHLHDLHRYPDGNGYYLKGTLAERFDVTPQEIILGNGSNELLELIVRTFYQPGMNTVSSEKSFVVYPLVTQAVGGEYRAAPMKAETYDLDALAERVDERTLCVFIANPNNPTGTIVTREALDRFFAAIPAETLVVMDEAYFEYVESPDYPDGLEFLKAGRNVMVLRTFSKIYGLAGLRIGYGFAHPEIIDALNRVREPFNTGSLAQAAALAALGDDSHVGKSLAVNREGRNFLYRALKGLGLAFTPTEANFIWIDTGRDGRGLHEALLREGVIVRPMGGGYLRITIGLPEENQRLVTALTKVLSAG